MLARMNAEPDHSATLMASIGARLRAAAAALRVASSAQRDQALHSMAAALQAAAPAILAANAADVAAFTGSGAMADRLILTPARLTTMAQGLATIAALPDPLARDLGTWTRPNGLQISRIPQPIGVLAMIFESRPNVFADAAALALKSGNCLLLRGGSESFRSTTAIAVAIATGLEAAGLPADCILPAPTSDRHFVAAMLGATGLIDLLIPRGGKALVERVQREARVPVLAHAEGLNHTYIHEAADLAMAIAVLRDAKLRRTAVCGATEILLLDAAVAPSLLPALVTDLSAHGCSFRADERARHILPHLPAAGPDDFDTEWLDATLSIKIVDGPDSALAHIAAHGSSHTEAIITADRTVAESFLARSTAAVTLWNASTQFCDGGEFGFGGEIGIATGALHARGPIGAEQLTSFRYVIRGAGQIRG
jgi:glutamate-5-semialdehyde dehydrogenase